MLGCPNKNKEISIIFYMTKYGWTMLEKDIREKHGLLKRHYHETFIEDHFLGVGGCRLRYIKPRKISSSNGLLILGGRTEYIEKYQELFFDLRALDFSLYSYDHRGQGLSQRLLNNSHKGHVNSFSDYVTDLKNFIESVMAVKHQCIIVLGFSMGGAITTLCVLDYPDLIHGAILCCPMFAINTFPLSQTLVGWFAEKAVLLGMGDNYVPGGKGYNFKPRFAFNLYSSSLPRFTFTRNMVQDNPQLALGSPTIRWLFEAAQISQRLLKGAEKISIPILLLQSGRDKLVRNNMHIEFCKRAVECEIHPIAGARHELLIERDELRNQALQHITDFLQKQLH